LVEYVKTVWENGKTALNAARMNNMEQGISDCATQINKLGDSVYHNGGISLGSTISNVYLDADGQTFYIEYRSRNKKFVITMRATEGSIPG
uniref:hypothetical protein n=1 Tax=Collinsella aerofaciens TaxID=74426 RepID=UPI0018CC6CE9